MGDLADALREAGHTEIANQLERKALAGDLRKVGRGDLADALESGEQHEATAAPDTETEVDADRMLPNSATKSSPRTFGTRSTRAVPTGSARATMPRGKQSAHAQRDRLRQEAAEERVRARALDVALETAKLKVESAARAVTDAYSAEDADWRGSVAKELQAAEAEAVDLGHRVTAAGQRLEHAQRQVDTFTQEHARDLPEERAPEARELALKLTRCGHDLVKLHRAYIAMRTDIDALVGAIPEAVVRSDGPAPPSCMGAPAARPGACDSRGTQDRRAAPSLARDRVPQAQDEVGRLLRKEAA